MTASYEKRTGRFTKATAVILCAVAFVALLTGMKTTSGFTSEQMRWIEENRKKVLRVVYYETGGTMYLVCEEGFRHGFIPDFLAEFESRTGISADLDYAESIELTEDMLDADRADITLMCRVPAGLSATKHVVAEEFSFFKNIGAKINAVSGEAMLCGYLDLSDKTLDEIKRLYPNITMIKFNSYYDLNSALTDKKIELLFGPYVLYSSMHIGTTEHENLMRSIYVDRKFVGKPEYVDILDSIMNSLDINAMMKPNTEISNKRSLSLGHKKIQELNEQNHFKIAFYDVMPFMAEIDGQAVGLMRQLVNEIRITYGINHEFVPGDYYKLLEMFEEKQIDVFPCVEITPVIDVNENLTAELSDIHSKDSKAYTIHEGTVNLYGLPYKSYISYQQAFPENAVTKIAFTAQTDIMFLRNPVINSQNVEFVSYRTLTEAKDAILSGDADYIAVEMFDSQALNDTSIVEKGVFASYKINLYVHRNSLEEHVYEALFGDLGPFSASTISDKSIGALNLTTYLYEISILKAEAEVVQRKYIYTALITIVFLVVMLGLLARTGYMLWIRSQQRKTDYLKYNDYLTQIKNRLSAEIYIQELLEQGAEFHMGFADIDFFKRINDGFGHDVGDKSIIHTAQVLNEEFAVDGIAARIGGDEFLFITKETNREQLELRLKRVQRKVSRLMNNDEWVNLSISIGLCRFPQDGGDMEDIFLKADKALYASKDGGRNRFSFYADYILSNN